jgi:hypothetical protein
MTEEALDKINTIVLDYLAEKFSALTGLREYLRSQVRGGLAMARTERIYLRVNPKLKKKIQDYCDREHTSLSELITRLLVRLLHVDEKQDVRQI